MSSAAERGASPIFGSGRGRFGAPKIARLERCQPRPNRGAMARFGSRSCTEGECAAACKTEPVKRASKLLREISDRFSTANQPRGTDVFAHAREGSAGKLRARTPFEPMGCHMPHRSFPFAVSVLHSVFRALALVACLMVSAPRNQDSSPHTSTALGGAS